MRDCSSSARVHSRQQSLNSILPPLGQVRLLGRQLCIAGVPDQCRRLPQERQAGYRRATRDSGPSTYSLCLARVGPDQWIGLSPVQIRYNNPGQNVMRPVVDINAGLELVDRGLDHLTNTVYYAKGTLLLTLRCNIL